MSLPVRLAMLLLGAVSSLFPHSMSMSSGDLSVEGSEAVLSIYVPAYEAQDVDEKTDLLGAFQISVGDAPLKQTQASCALNDAEATYECTARFELPEEVSAIEVECRLPEVVSPNHVHVLRAVSPAGNEQQVFDYASRRHAFRFRPIGLMERLGREFAVGALRMLLGPAQLFFLFALSVAARSRRELVRMAAAFLVSLAAAAVVIAQTNWRPPPGFVDSAGALTVAYLAVETLVLPEARGRWVVAGAMGVFHGLFFGLFLQQAAMQPAAVLGGAAIASLVAIGLLFVWPERLFGKSGLTLFRKASSALLCLVGVGWFLFRVF